MGIHRSISTALAAGLAVALALGAAGAAAPFARSPAGQAAHDALFQKDGFATPVSLSKAAEGLEIAVWAEGDASPAARALTGRVQSWPLGDGSVADIATDNGEGGVVVIKALVWTADDRLLRADLPVPVGGEGVMRLDGGARLHLAVRTTGLEFAPLPEQLTEADGPLDLDALMGTLTKLKPNKSVMNYKLPKLSPAEVDRYWATSGLPRPEDPKAAYARAYLKYLDNTPFQGRPGGLRSHIPDGVLIDTLGSVALPSGSGMVFGNTATRDGGTMQIGPNLRGKNYYSSFTRYDVTGDGYITINKVVVVDDTATLMTGLKVRPDTMTTVKIAGDILISVYPVIRREGDLDFTGQPVVDGNARDGLPPIL